MSENFQKRTAPKRNSRPAANGRKKAPVTRSVARTGEAARLSDGSVNLAELSRGKKPAHRTAAPPPKKSLPRRIFGTIGKVLMAGTLIAIITGCLVVGIFAVYVFGFIDSSMDGYDLLELQQDYSTTLYLTDPKTGERITEPPLAVLHGGENRIWVSYDEMAQNLRNAFVAIEDERFETHNGVDWKRTTAAFVNMFYNITDSSFGGSTITQQLVKNLTKDDSRSAMRKVREIMRAHTAERKYDKSIILECYLNTVDLSSGCWGVEVASEYYFGKKASELNLVESAALASIVKAPTHYNPIREAEANKDRRKLVLGKMLELGFISQSEYDEAVDAKLVTVGRQTDKKEEVNSFFVDAVIEDLRDQLIVAGYDSKAATSKVYTGGFKVDCTLNPAIQKIVSDYYANDKNFPRETHKYTGTKTDENGKTVTGTFSEGLESAMVIMDYQGHIVAMAGGRKKKTANREFNFATHAKRQAGSSTKPITVYAPGIEMNVFNYGTPYPNQPSGKVNGQSWPRNSGTAYGGSYTVQRALEKSLNTVAVKALIDLKLENSFDFATQKLHITTLVREGKDNDFGLPALALGGNSYGVTVKEMTAAYATFGNLGVYYRPATFSKIYDQHDNEVLPDHLDPEQAMGEDTANIMNEMLQKVVISGTGTGARFGGWPIFGKTGTATAKKDLWFVGGTPYYVAGVWVGFEHPYKTNTSTSTNQAIWRNIMTAIHKDLSMKSFPESEMCGYYKYCTASGMVATSSCPGTAMGWYKTGALKPCTKHKGTVVQPSKKPTPAGAASKASSGTSSTSSKATSTPPAATSSKPTGTQMPSAAPSQTPSVAPPPASVDPPASQDSPSQETASE